MSKYRNKPIEIDGRVFHSQKEGRHYIALKTLERAGKISELECQVVYPLDVNGQRICKYILDFRYREADQRVHEDVKGVETPAFKLKRKLMKAIYGIEVRCV